MINKADERQVRRSFIFERLKERGVVSYKEIQERFPQTSRQLLKKDTDQLKINGVEIESCISGRNGILFSPHQARIENFEFRKSYNQRLKEKVADVTMALCLLEKEIESEALEDVFGVEILCSEQSNIDKLTKKLNDFRQNTNRRFFFDGGTTTAQLATLFSAHSLRENIETIIDGLEVWTNNFKIVDHLRRPDSQAKVLSIAGEYSERTNAIRGDFAERFVRKMLPEIDLAVVGCSKVYLPKYQLTNSESDECYLKKLILKRSGLKIAIADSSKFIDMGASYPLDYISSKDVDLIVTTSADGLPPSETPVMITQ